MARMPTIENHSQGCLRESSRGARVPADSASGAAMDGRTQGVPCTTGQQARENATDAGPTPQGKAVSLLFLAFGGRKVGGKRGCITLDLPSIRWLTYAALD